MVVLQQVVEQHDYGPGEEPLMGGSSAPSGLEQGLLECRMAVWAIQKSSQQGPWAGQGVVLREDSVQVEATPAVKALHLLLVPQVWLG